MPRTFTTPTGEELTLDPSQDRAIDMILAELKTPGSESRLAGAAGCGKSVLMALLIQLWKGPVILLAPTGKAASRLSETSGRKATTVHSSIFRTVEELDKARPRPQRSEDRLSLLDNLRKVVFSRGGSLLLVGDHKQLGPVVTETETLIFGEAVAPDGLTRRTLVIVDEASMLVGADLEQARARLETVHRQALQSPVLELATLIRQGKGRTFTNWGNEAQRIYPATVQQAVDWAEEARSTLEALAEFTPADQEVTLPTRILLTWTNKVRALANSLTREKRGYPRGEVQEGETLLCTFNNHSLGRMNGEVVDVARVEPCPELSECLGTTVQWVIETDEEGEETKFLVLPQTFDHPDVLAKRRSERRVYRDAWKPLWAKKRPTREGEESAYTLCHRLGWSMEDLRMWRERVKNYGLQATWGYCLTVHKSQGSQYDEVGFISCPGFRGYDDVEFKRRLTYTAVTRASERFIAFMLSVVPDYRKTHPYAGT